MEYTYKTNLDTELKLNKLQMDALIKEINYYGIDNIIFLYEVAQDVYKKNSTMWNFIQAKINFLKHQI